MRERGYGDLLGRLQAAWLAAAEQSLAHNASTVAVLSIDEILKPYGYVDQLRRKGYAIEDP